MQTNIVFFEHKENAQTCVIINNRRKEDKNVYVIVKAPKGYCVMDISIAIMLGSDYEILTFQ